LRGTRAGVRDHGTVTFEDLGTNSGL